MQFTQPGNYRVEIVVEETSNQMRMISTKIILEVEPALELKGLISDESTGLWNRGDRNIIGHNSAFNIEGLTDIQSRHPGLTINCEVYTDDSALAYTTAVAFNT